MAFGFPARFAESRTYSLQQDELVAVLESALKNLGWSYEIEWGKNFRALVSSGPWSWGEELRAEILPTGKVQAESKSAGQMLAFFDFGKNKKNVEEFFALVEHGINQGVYERPAASASPEAGQFLAQTDAVEQLEPGKPATPQNRRAANLFGGCLIATIVLVAFGYFVSSVIGLLTGYLYLPGRGRSGLTLNGVWARIISAVILMFFAWVVLWVLRARRKRPRAREE